jgi:asparagine synthase (glutamine-hydrolysing)
MCGIAGTAGVADRRLVERMLAQIRHRGPNDSGVYATNSDALGGRVALGNVRLSILDLSVAGRQPMCNEDESVWVAYNGEIFNFKELRDGLLSDGHHFRSHTDTEVLPHLYEKYGPAMVTRLNGMFAFALWDSRKQQLFLFRDRAGIKPVYYTQIGKELYFASEIKALLQCARVSAEIDGGALAQYLGLLYVPNPQTCFKNIHKLSPGHSLTWENGEVSITQYWDMKFGPYSSARIGDLARDLRDVIVRATHRQLISDVPVGFFLSGGLDSSTLVASAAAANKSSLRCYSITFRDQDSRLEQSSDDARYARLVAREFGANFHEIVSDPQVSELLPKIVYHLDEPVADPAAIATYLICRAAKRDVTVLISGQGGDEVFAGYRVHLLARLRDAARRVPRWARKAALQRAIPWLVANHGRLPGKAPGFALACCRFSAKLLGCAQLDEEEQYAFLRSYLSAQEISECFSPDFRAAVGDQSYDMRIMDHLADCDGEDLVNRMLYVDFKTFLPDLNLCYSDKLSMACSVEVRVPLLDNEVVDFMLRVAPSLKIQGLTQKYLLKKAMEPLLPASVVHRRKASFGLPVRAWLRNELRTMLRDCVSEDVIRKQGIFDPKVVSRMIEDNESCRRDYTMQLWGLLTFHVWSETFVRSSVSMQC